MEDFKNIKNGDYLVSLVQNGDNRYSQDIFCVEKKDSLQNYIGHKGCSSSSPKEWRLATEEEINWFKKDIIKNGNLNNMPKDLVINNYQIF